MTLESVSGIGYCARMTAAGDWAFDFALDLALRHQVRLNVFFFPSPPTQPHLPRGRRGELLELAPDRKVALEREVREYYDKLLGDFVEVGFRLCEGDEEPELRRCLLMRRDYNVLVLSYEGYRCHFGSKTIEEFAESMICSVALVGPEGPNQIYLNSRASLSPWPERLGLVDGDWKRVGDVKITAPPPDSEKTQNRD
jgi:hypothetical protein